MSFCNVFGHFGEEQFLRFSIAGIKSRNKENEEDRLEIKIKYQKKKAGGWINADEIFFSRIFFSF